MSELPVALGGEAVQGAAEAPREASRWIETAVAVIFAAAAVLFVSFIAVVTGLA